MITLLTTPQRRDYLVNKHGIQDTLSPNVMQTIQENIDFDLVAKRERRIEDLERDLKLLPGDADLLAVKQKLIDVIAEDIEAVHRVIAQVKTRASEVQMRKAKEQEILQQAKRKIVALEQELTADARKLNSESIANLARHVSKLAE